MSLIALGINHNTAPVEVREKVAFSTDMLSVAFSSLRQHLDVAEAVILSTCNRTEIYVHGDMVKAQSLSPWLADFHRLPAQSLQPCVYLYQQQQSVQHLMRVASGLDSMILGEPQILGQVKQAYVSAKHCGVVGGQFEKLFQQTFAVAKKVRSETEIGANAISVAYASVQLARHIFSSLKQSRVLLIGAGETIELVAKHLKEQNVKHICVANRTLARAKLLAEPVGGDTLTLEQIPGYLSQADIVISSTASPLPILGKGMVEQALKARRRRPMFFVDLAVPRDIEAEVTELSDAYLYTVDDLQQIVQQNMASRQQAAHTAEQMVLAQASDFMQWFASQDSIDMLKRFRQQNLAQRDKLINKALKQIQDGQSAEQVIEELATRLTNNLLHPSTQAIKMATQQPDTPSMPLISEAFGLTGKNKNNG